MRTWDDYIQAEDESMTDAWVNLVWQEFKKQGRRFYDTDWILFTGKDSDLDGGQILARVICPCDDEKITLEVQIGYTVPGYDVCLNEEGKDWTDLEYDCACEQYLEKAENIVMGCGMNGEWTGDDWLLYETEVVTVAIDRYLDEADIPKIVKELVNNVWEVAEPYLNELSWMQKALNEAAGW